MADFRVIQEFQGFKGDESDDIIPVRPTWMDTMGHKELVVDFLILRNDATTGCPEIVLETAITEEGPWTTIATFGSGYTHAQVYCTSRETGTNRMERLVRYRIGLEGVSEWETCLRICAAMK